MKSPSFAASAGAVNRRRLLQALGLSSAAGLTPSLAPRAARAADPAPRFLGIMFTEHGIVPQRFFFTRGDLPRDKPWEFSLADLPESAFSPGLRPLWRHRRKMIVIEGLSHFTAFTGAGDDHGRGMATAITGATCSRADGVKSISDGPSLDQILAAELRKKDPSLTNLTALVMSVSRSAYPFHHSVWAQSGTSVVKVPLQGDYPKLHASLFGGLGGSAPPTDPVAAQQGRLLDLVSTEYDRLAKAASSEDRLRLEQHRSMLSDLQKRMAGQGTPMGCTKPTIPSAGDWHRNNEIMAKLTAAAWNCRLSRISYHHFTQIPNALVGASGDFHQAYAHRWNTDPEATRGCSKADEVHAGLFAKWADELDGISNGAGGTLLDSATLMWTGEIANGGHSHSKNHFVLLGGGGGAFKTGRYIYFPGQGRPHNHLLVSLARMMGMDTNRIGVATARNTNTTGPLVELGG
jgi:hypothetical protein